MKTYQDILLSKISKSVLTITLNRPESYNALCNNLLKELAHAFDSASSNADIKCIVITGSERVFAAGADIKEMAELNTIGVLQDKRPQYWDSLRKFQKPIIASVNGYALGGGCELALHADIIIAGSNAKFGQPEINLGIMPGAGGTQRLIRTIGKSLAMKMVLGGEPIDAKTALQSGLIAEITQPELTLERAIELAQRIASKPAIAVQLAKQALLDSFENSLEMGLSLERKAFTILAASEDRQEGIQAFIEKRKAEFKGA
jgi:enoyl-CoA hydratase